ncbi:unnamed protein product [Caenorhabditis nigoni]
MDPTTANYQKASELFPNSDDFSKLKLYNLMLALEKLARPSLQFQYFLSIFGIVLTILHLVILTRKGMMMSSIIAIMVGIGICDLIAMIATIQSVDFFFDEEGTDCTPPISYFTYKSSWVFVVIRDFVRRSSTWLAVMMALIRFVFIKFGAKLPIGISWCFQVAYTNFGFLYLATYLNHLCNSIFIINATFHGIVCFMMSSQYRATVWKILRLNKDQPATSNRNPIRSIQPRKIFDKTKKSKMRYRMLLSFFFTTTSDSVAKGIFGHHFDTENEILVNFKKRSKI